MNFLGLSFYRDEKPYEKTLTQNLKNLIFVNSEKIQTALISKPTNGIAFNLVIWRVLLVSLTYCDCNFVSLSIQEKRSNEITFGTSSYMHR